MDITGRSLKKFPASLSVLEDCEPSYEEMDGWDEDLAEIKSVEQLPANALRFIERIEELTGVPVWIVSVGPQRDMYFELSDCVLSG